MKAEAKLLGLLVPTVLSALVGMIACSAPATDGSNEVACKGKNCDDEDSDKKNTRSSDDDLNSDESKRPSSSPSSASNPNAADASIDAPKAPPGSSAPPPTTKNCQDLSSCCGGLQDFGDKIACIGVSLAGNETGCGAALTVCRAGGVGIGGIFSNENPQCAELSKCCKQFKDNGYSSTAADCADWVKTEDEDLCQGQLGFYQDFGECL